MLPNMSDPSFDPLVLLEEFKEWAIENKNTANCGHDMLLMVHKWLREKYDINTLDYMVDLIKRYTNTYIGLPTPIPKSEITAFADMLINLWELHHGKEL